MADPPSSEDRYTAAFPALHRRAYAVAYRLVGRPAPAEDIAQETLARAYVRWAKLADDPTGWCVTVAFNLAMDHLRSAERDRTRHRQLIAVDELSVADPRLAERLDLYAALRELPRRQRQIVALRYLGDLTEQQTADALGISVGNVKSQASRGLATLRTRHHPQELPCLTTSTTRTRTASVRTTSSPPPVAAAGRSSGTAAAPGSRPGRQLSPPPPASPRSR